MRTRSRLYIGGHSLYGRAGLWDEFVWSVGEFRNCFVSKPLGRVGDKRNREKGEGAHGPGGIDLLLDQRLRLSTDALPAGFSGQGQR